VSTVTTLHPGHDVAYLTTGQHAGGCVGAMSYYTAAGEPPGQWAGKGAAALGLTGRVDSAVIGRLYQHNIGPSGQLLVKRRPSRTAGEREAAAVAAYRAAHPYASATELAARASTAITGPGGSPLPVTTSRLASDPGSLRNRSSYQGDVAGVFRPDTN
jgi:TrwC relaxase